MGIARKSTRGVLFSGRTVLAWLAISSLGLSMSGCVIGPIIGQFTGRGSKTVKVEAKYELPPGNLLILVDIPEGEAARNGVRAVLSSEVERERSPHPRRRRPGRTPSSACPRDLHWNGARRRERAPHAGPPLQGLADYAELLSHACAAAYRKKRLRSRDRARLPADEPPRSDLCRRAKRPW